MNVCVCMNTNELSLKKQPNFIIFICSWKKYNIDKAEKNKDGKHIEFTKCVGIIINEHLNWKPHIDTIGNKNVI